MMEEDSIIHGDCMVELPKIPDHSVDMVLADPPYGSTRNRWDTPLDMDALWPEIWRVCRNLGRRFIGIEIDAGYYEVARERIADMREGGE